MKTLLYTAVRFYRKWISPALPGSCRFAPTCSEYALQALDKYGAWKGACLTIGRLFRCHPFHAGGYDPVPEDLGETEKRGNGETELRLAGQFGQEEDFTR